MKQPNSFDCVVDILNGLDLVLSVVDSHVQPGMHYMGHMKHDENEIAHHKKYKCHHHGHLLGSMSNRRARTCEMIESSHFYFCNA